MVHYLMGLCERNCEEDIARGNLLVVGDDSVLLGEMGGWWDVGTQIVGEVTGDRLLKDVVAAVQPSLNWPGNAAILDSLDGAIEAVKEMVPTWVVLQGSRWLAYMEGAAVREEEAERRREERARVRKAEASEARKRAKTSDTGASSTTVEAPQQKGKAKGKARAAAPTTAAAEEEEEELPGAEGTQPRSPGPDETLLEAEPEVVAEAEPTEEELFNFEAPEGEAAAGTGADELAEEEAEASTAEVIPEPEAEAAHVPAAHTPTLPRVAPVFTAAAGGRGADQPPKRVSFAERMDQAYAEGKKGAKAREPRDSPSPARPDPKAEKQRMALLAARARAVSRSPERAPPPPLPAAPRSSSSTSSSQGGREETEAPRPKPPAKHVVKRAGAGLPPPAPRKP